MGLAARQAVMMVAAGMAKEGAAVAQETAAVATAWALPAAEVMAVEEPMEANVAFVGALLLSELQNQPEKIRQCCHVQQQARG